MPSGQTIECLPFMSVTGAFDIKSVEYRIALGIPSTVTVAPSAFVTTRLTGDGAIIPGVTVLQ